MPSFQELYIQSNIPLIIIVVSIICICIIGFLEFKKQSNMISNLSTELNALKNKGGVTSEDKGNNDVKRKNDNIHSKDKIKEEKMQHVPEQVDLVEKMLNSEGQVNQDGMPDIKQMFEEGLTEEQFKNMGQGVEMMTGGIPPIIGSGGIASMIIGGPMMAMGEMQQLGLFEGQMGQPSFDELEEINSEKEIENIDEEIENYEGPTSDEINEDNNFEELDEEKNINITEESESESESGTESESDGYSESSDDGSIKEMVEGKGVVEDVKEIDRNLSIKELKEICQKIGVSISGNKETLIKRINSKK